MPEDLISIIVPVYNVEQYLRKCLDSIISQTYKNFECILVDDGSTDSSGKICDEYSLKDHRFSVVHKTNGGVSSARNTGLDVIGGSYVTFIDSDDYVTDNYLEYLYDMINAFKADVAAVSYEMVFNETAKDTSANIDDYKKICFERKDAIKELLQIRNISQMVWAKLYKTELFEQIRFPVGKIYGEDLAVIFDIVLLADKVVCSNAALYKYCMRKGSVMQSDFTEDKYVEINIIDDKMKMIDEEYADLKLYSNARRLYSYFKMVHRIMSSNNKRKYYGYIKELKKKIKYTSVGMLRSPDINVSLKIKILAFKFGVNVYEAVQNISDIIKQIKQGHRYIV